jgi:hypothetical protein
MVPNWLRAYPGALRFVEVIEEGDHVAVLEKIAEATSPRRSFSRSVDAHVQAAVQPITSCVRRVAMELRRR